MHLEHIKVVFKILQSLYMIYYFLQFGLESFKFFLFFFVNVIILFNLTLKFKFFLFPSNFFNFNFNLYFLFLIFLCNIFLKISSFNVSGNYGSFNNANPNSVCTHEIRNFSFSDMDCVKKNIQIRKSVSLKNQD